jgi:hypothetical protein
MDARSLKMYDVCEEDLWFEDAELSGDERASVDHEAITERRRANQNARRRRNND